MAHMKWKVALGCIVPVVIGMSLLCGHSHLHKVSEAVVVNDTRHVEGYEIRSLVGDPVRFGRWVGRDAEGNVLWVANYDTGGRRHGEFVYWGSDGVITLIQVYREGELAAEFNGFSK